MHRRRRLVLAASIAALVTAPLAPSAFAGDTAATGSTAAAAATGTPIVYSDLYLKLIAAYPLGFVYDSCNAVLQVTGRTGVCTATLALEYFRPDGTFGKMPWFADQSSSTGWSVQPDPCDALTEADDRLWGEYQTYLWGYSETGPDLTAEQIALYDLCWPMGF